MHNGMNEVAMDTKKRIGVSAVVVLTSFAGGLAFGQTNQRVAAGAANAYWCARADMGSWMVGPFNTAQITPEKAKGVAQRYANTYLRGFNVEKVSSVAGLLGMTMYSVDLRGPNDDMRTLHVNPWGVVVPYGEPMWHFE
jgi:hypothetical protein